jgi:Tol biopolymer transport system component
MKRKGRLLLVLGLLFLVPAGGIAWSQTTERVSVDTTGSDGNNTSTAPSTSANGRYVAFESFASDLVANDIGGNADVFVRDRQTGTTTRMSVDSGGTEGDQDSNDPSISADGRYVAFESDATNLLGVVNDTNGWPDVFVHDRDADGDGTYDEAGEVSTIRVSVYSDETESNDPSNHPSISADGRYVAFESGGELDLMAIEILLFPDIFVHDRDTDGDGIYDEPGAVSTIRVSEDSAGNEANEASSSPSISVDGRYVAFESVADNLVANDTLGFIDVFVYDRDADGDGVYDEPGAVSIVRVSVDSADTQANGDSSSASISADGRYVAFVSNANNLVGVGNDTNGKFDIFVHDRDTDEDGIYDEAGSVSTVRVSVHSDGTEGNEASSVPSISADGRYVAFYSEANNLVANDNNVSADVFVHELQTGTTTRVSVDSAGTEGNDTSSDPSISANGKYVAFESDADNLVAGDNNNFSDIFVYDRESLPPTVALTSPVDSATNAAVGAGITATFSEPMQASTINTNTFTIDNGVTGTVSYDANSTTATFTPTSNLNYDTTYTATITTGAEDLAGNDLQANYTWSFTTQSEGNSGGNSGCFIATAADGSRMAGELK